MKRKNQFCQFYPTDNWNHLQCPTIEKKNLVLASGKFLGALGGGIGTCLVFWHSFSKNVHIDRGEKIEPFCGTNKCRDKRDCKDVGTKRDIGQVHNSGLNEARLCNGAGRCVYNKLENYHNWDKPTWDK